MSRILIVEDEERMAKTLVKGLANSNHTTHVITDGVNARIEDISKYDLVILDWMLPQFSGIDILDYWRKVKKFTTPIIMFTAKDDINSKVRGLDTGADDYISKFFTWDELNARIRNQLKKSVITKEINIPIEYDPVNYSFSEEGMVINLTKSELIILKYFFEHPTKLILKDSLNNVLYNDEFDPNSNTIERHIKSIRSKFNYDPITTIRGSGYRLRTETEPKKTTN